jgi:hypothetical protein
MKHDQKVRDAATLLLRRHGEKAPEVARRWSQALIEREDPEAAAVCLEPEAANELLGAQKPHLSNTATRERRKSKRHA